MVRAEPGRQTIFAAFWPKSASGESSFSAVHEISPSAKKNKRFGGKILKQRQISIGS